jgi:hypothetical protein
MITKNRLRGTLTLQQRLKAADTIRRLVIVHEFYMDNPDATINKAVAFIPESRAMCYKYSAIRTECQSLITAVLDERYGCVWKL